MDSKGNLSDCLQKSPPAMRKGLISKKNVLTFSADRGFSNKKLAKLKK